MNKKVMFINIMNLNFSPKYKLAIYDNQFISALTYFEHMCPNVEIKDSFLTKEDIKDFLSKIESNKKLFILTNQDKNWELSQKSKTVLVENFKEWINVIKNIDLDFGLNNSFDFIYAQYVFDNKYIENLQLKDNLEEVDSALYNLLENNFFSNSKYLTIILFNNDIQNFIWFINTDKQTKMDLKTKDEIIEYIYKTVE
ncbi:hypothetical protein [Mycoplasmopsis adleri]|uniref:hypothetical protein n=1 Tax=Mycoplasmopsis adleri TaxID=51362 RepID=UPI0038736C60